MSDAADILGIKQSAPSSSAEVAAKLMADAKPIMTKKPAKKPKGMSREVFDLLGRDQDSLVPAMQSNASVASGAFKSKRVSALKGKWIWAPFASSARPKDEVNKTFHHWVKADVQYIDYPYAKFNVKMDAISYTDDEYEHLLKSDKWTRAETDHLMYICYKYDLRWPVIVDRYSMIPVRRTEDIQERYYSIVSKIRAHRTSTYEGAVSVKNEAATTFDHQAERARREQQECLFRKSKLDEAEEVKLREELKLIDAVLKVKKGGRPSAGAVAAKGTAAESKQIAAAAAANALSYSSSPFSLPLPPEHSPTAGKPCLQSTRLTVGDQSANLSRVLVKKMQSLLRELGAPEQPLPTRAVCDAYDGVRKDAVSLLSVHNAIQKKEKELAALRALNPSAGGGSKCTYSLTH
jgi:DNA methyltransferase 1-associated protein 1